MVPINLSMISFCKLRFFELNIFYFYFQLSLTNGLYNYNHWQSME